MFVKRRWPGHSRGKEAAHGLNTSPRGSCCVTPRARPRGKIVTFMWVGSTLLGIPPPVEVSASPAAEVSRGGPLDGGHPAVCDVLLLTEQLDLCARDEGADGVGSV